MGKSLHKDILNTLKSASKLPTEGNHLRRLITLTSMITSCIETQSSTIEGISVLEFAFIFAFTIGCILKQQEPNIINKITRFDRIQECHPITLVIKCFQKKPFLVIYFLSLISKN
jgi:hypothetical protein